jgi:hypothetical protein
MYLARLYPTAKWTLINPPRSRSRCLFQDGTQAFHTRVSLQSIREVYDILTSKRTYRLTLISSLVKLCETNPALSHLVN